MCRPDNLKSQTDQCSSEMNNTICSNLDTFRYNQKAYMLKILGTINKKCKTCLNIKDFVHIFHGLLQVLKDMSEKTEDKILFQVRHFLS